MLNFAIDTLSLPSVPSELGHQRNLIGSYKATISHGMYLGRKLT